MEISLSDSRLDTVSHICRRKGRLYIYGCGRNAMVISAYLQKCGCDKIHGYVVDDEYLDGDSSAQSISQFLMIFDKDNDSLVCGFSSYTRYREVLSDQAVLGETNFYFIPLPVSMELEGGYISDKYYIRHKEDFERTYERLADDRSRQLMEAYLQAQISGKLEELQDFQKEPQEQYFDPCMPNCYDVFIDCGGYMGDTFDAAVRKGCKFEKYILFEPDSENLKEIYSAIGKYSALESAIRIIPKAIWKEQTRLAFSSSGSSSKIENGGQRLLRQRRLMKYLQMKSAWYS